VIAVKKAICEIEELAAFPAFLDGKQPIARLKVFG